MGSASRLSKRSKRSEDLSESSLESDRYDEIEVGSEGDSGMEMELSLNQFEQDEDEGDDSGSDPEAEDAEESNVVYLLCLSPSFKTFFFQFGINMFYHGIGGRRGG